MVAAALSAFATTTTAVNVHRGAVLPIARAVVIAVPTTLLLVFWWVSSRRRDQDS